MLKGLALQEAAPTSSKEGLRRGIWLLAPFLSGFENVVGTIIIGIGLCEDFKLNRALDPIRTVRVPARRPKPG